VLPQVLHDPVAILCGDLGIFLLDNPVCFEASEVKQFSVTQ
jgi:hypothetical protein